MTYIEQPPSKTFIEEAQEREFEEWFERQMKKPYYKAGEAIPRI